MSSNVVAMPRVQAAAASHTQTAAHGETRSVGGEGHPLVNLALSPQANGQTRHVQANEPAWDPKTDAGTVVFVREGLLRVYHGVSEGRKRLVGLVAPGGFAAVESLAGANASATTIVAAEPSTVTLVDADRLVQLALSEPDAGRELLGQLARTAVQLNSQVTETTLLDCESQLVHALLRLGRTAVDDNGNGNAAPEAAGAGRVTLRLTQQDLADALGIARETVNGMLQRLGEQQLIAKRRGRISFDIAQLEQRASHTKN